MSLTLRNFILGNNLCRVEAGIAGKLKKIMKRGLHIESEDSAVEDLNGPLFLAALAEAGYCTAALVTDKGKIAKVSTEPSKLYSTGIFWEMSSNLIWQSLVLCIKNILHNVDVKNVKGIGFTATPALVCLDEKGEPVTASVSRDPNINCIAYYDKRSVLEAEKINTTHHALLQYFGDKALPDLHDSKLLWLKNNLNEDCWSRIGHFMDLSDFLTWKATGSFVRSSSILASKWSYELTVNGLERWNSGFFNEIGMPELAQENFIKLGTLVQRPGTPIPGGLSVEAAETLGLPSKLPVATALPDAVSGGLGIIGCQVDKLDTDFTTRLCIHFSSRSSSHFIVSYQPIFVKGVMGPFKDCLLPNTWLNIAGQTAAEGILDHIIGIDPSAPQIKKHIQKYLNKILRIEAQKNKMSSSGFLTKNLHILPDFDGNRSPIVDPNIRGMISGLPLRSNTRTLAHLYLATMQALTYSTRHIIGTLNRYGHKVGSIIVGGDLGKNSLFMTLHKEICQLPTIVPDEHRSRLIGAAILGAIAAEHFRSFDQAIHAMCGRGQVMLPEENKALIDYHNRKFQVFLKMYEHQLEYRRIMSCDDTSKQCYDKKRPCTDYNL